MYRSWNDVWILNRIFRYSCKFFNFITYRAILVSTIRVEIKILENVLDDSTILLQNKH